MIKEHIVIATIIAIAAIATTSITIIKVSNNVEFLIKNDNIIEKAKQSVIIKTSMNLINFVSFTAMIASE
jgi:hypothetical protein